MAFDANKPYDEVYGNCDVVPGAKYLQSGVYYSADGKSLAGLNGGKPRKQRVAVTKEEGGSNPDSPTVTSNDSG